MSGNDWVQEGTPKESDDWSQEQDDYGVPVETDWNDYSSEQTVPVPTPRPAEPEPEPIIEPEPVVEVEQPAAESAPEPEAAADPFEQAGLPEQLEPTEPERAADEAEFAAPTVVAESPEFAEPVAEPTPPRPVVVETPSEAAPAPAAEPELPAPAAFAAQVPDAGAPDEAQLADPEALTETRAIDSLHAEQPGEAPLNEEGSLGEETQVEETQVEETQVEETQVVEELPSSEDATAVGMAGLYRDETGERTQVIDTSAALAAEAAEEAEREEQLRLEKEARDQRLGLVATSEANALRDPLPPRRPGLGGFGSFGMLLLRLVLAFSLGVYAWQILGDVEGTADLLGQTLLPYPTEVTWALGFTLAAMAVMLVLGLGVRVVGFLLVVIAAGALAFLRWGPFPIFVDGMEGFIGDRELLLAGLGLLLFSIGGGKAGIDGAISKARWNAKLAKNH